MRRVFAISDLHIGGASTPMLGHPERLQRFLEQVAEYEPPPGTEVELVINGDFVDFLAEQPYAAWTADQASAWDKFNSIVKRNRGLFTALARAIRDGRRLTLLLGNHDVELAYPRVRAAMYRQFGTDEHRCHFVINNECYRVGDVLIEHGNRYDSWNAIDHGGLRDLLAWFSRYETPGADAMQVCPGSRLVEEVMNPLKEQYHFVDLLKPETVMVPLLLWELEPGYRERISRVWGAAPSFFRTVVRKARKLMAGGEQPRMLVGGQDDDDDDDDLSSFDLSPDLENIFGEVLRDLEYQQVGVFREGGLDPNSLAARLRRGEEIPAADLKLLYWAIKIVLARDRSFEKSHPSGHCAAAAHRMIGRGAARLVIMGHTHLMRDIHFADLGGRYFNTGTWADLIRLDGEALAEASAGPKFTAWLRRLVSNDLQGIRVCEPYFADVTLDRDGHVVQADLRLSDGRAL